MIISAFLVDQSQHPQIKGSKSEIDLSPNWQEFEIIATADPTRRLQR
jgi:hypothetical protein